MTSIDAYLDEVRRGLAGMEPRVQRDILLELRSHISDSVTANAGNVGTVVAGFGDPKSVAKRYRELYGYGAVYRTLFAAIAGVVGVFSVPVLFAGPEAVFPALLSAAFLAVEFGFLIWVSVAAGNRVGLFSGITALAGRVMGFSAALVATRDGVLVTPDGLAAFAAVSAVLVLVGWIPGKAKQAWRRPGADL